VEGKSSPITLTTQFGESAEEPGLVIVNGKLDQLTVGVSSSFAIGGLAIEAKDLTLSLNTADNTYKFFGSASAKFNTSAEPVGVELLLGDAAQPGISIANGKLVSLNAGVNSNFNVAGVSINTKALTVALDVPTNTFTMSGSAGFAFKGLGSTEITLDAKLGESSAQPGLQIVNGKLASIDVSITSGFKVASVGFETEDLRLKFDAASGNRYAISGKAKATVEGKSSPITLTTQFGESAEEPGLVIVNGKLDQLTVGVSSSFAIGGLAIEAKDLTLALVPANSTYKFFGSASAKFGNNAETVGLELLLGNAAQPGINIANGKLVSLNAGVTSNFNVAGVSINTEALTVTLDVPTNTFTMSGKAGFSFKGVGNTEVSLAVQLGQPPQTGQPPLPGIKIVNGKLTELAVGVSGKFNMAGLAAEAKDLTFTYNRALNRYGFSGGAVISTAPVPGGKRVLDRFGVQIGSLASPGILVQNGQLERLDIALNGRINLGSLSINPRQLRVQFTRATNILQFTGGLTVSLAGKLTASGDLINGGLVINTENGEVRLNGLRLGISDTRIGTVIIRSAFIQFTQNSSNVISLSGGANVELPAGITVDGEFEIVNGRLRRIRLSLSKDPGFNIPNTPIFIQGVSGEINNLDTPDRLIVKGDMTFTAGPSYRISGRSVSLLQAKVGFEVNLTGTLNIPVIGAVQPFGANSGFVMLSGKMSMLGDAIPVGSGLVFFGFEKGTGKFLGVQARVEVRLYSGFLVGSLSLDLNGRSGDTTIKAGLAVVVPEILIPEVRFPAGLGGGVFIPATNLGGQRLASADVTVRLLANSPLDSSITFQGKFLNDVLIADAKVTFRGDLTVSGSVGIP
ncbi:MAG: hypothetical protein ACRCZF_08215, partial [Gemmataceae bacterium]